MPNHKILVIDDSKVIRMRVRDMLPAGNFEIIEAKDGLEGYHLMQSEQPNLIMLDFLLPKMSGWEVFQEIQKEFSLKQIPLVLMSGRKEEVVEKIPEPFKDFAFVEKPFEKGQLVAAIKEAMAKAPKDLRPPVPTPAAEAASVTPDTAAMMAEIEGLKKQVATMHQEMAAMKKSMSQLVKFIKQKLS
ncbi:MAG: response regulator [Microcystaceae cyanobacterium]